MNRKDGTERRGSSEKRISGRPLARSLGEAAVLLACLRESKNLVTDSKLQSLLDRLNITEREGHPQTVNIFKTLAKSFGVDVGEQQIAYWRSMLTVGRALDTIVDKTRPDSLDKEASALLNGEPIAGISQAEAEEFQQILLQASAERRAIILEGLAINDFAKELRTTTNPDEMLRLRREEGALFARIMTMDNPEKDASIEKFNSWLIDFGRAGYQVDSFVDLAHDFENGTSAVPPTPGTYFTVAREAARDAYASLSVLPKRTVASLAIAGMQKAARGALKVRS